MKDDRTIQEAPVRTLLPSRQSGTLVEGLEHPNSSSKGGSNTLVEPPVIAAIITGTCAIIAATTGAMLNRSRLKRFRLPEEHFAAGTWSGIASQESGAVDQIRTHTIVMTLECQGDTVHGDITYIAITPAIDITDPERENVIAHHPLRRFEITGKTIANRYVLTHYTNPASAFEQFGYAILKISSDMRTLRGRFVGVGAISNDIVHGTLLMEKQSTMLSRMYDSGRKAAV